MGQSDSTQSAAGAHLALVVDDNPGIRKYIKIVLRSANIEVLEAGDGLEALEVFHASSARIDLVITDIRMPRMMGTDLAVSLRSACPTIPVIFVSGEPAPSVAADRNNRTCFIEKPFAPAVLLAAARQAFDLVPAAF